MHSLQPNTVRVEASRRLAPRRHDVAMLSGMYTFAETLPAKHKPGERRDRGSMKKQVWPSQQMQRIPSFQRPALLPELLAAVTLGRPAARNVMATVVEMCHMPEKHLQALAPLCGEEVLGAVRIAARLPRNNQGRRRQENLVAKMLRSGLDGPALTKLMDFVQESRATKNTYLDQGLQHLIDSWRQGLMQGDQAVLQEVLALSARVQSTSGSTGEAAAATHALSSPNSQEEEAWVADSEGEEEGEEEEEEEEGQRITGGLAASLVLNHHPDHKTGTEAGGDAERDGAGGAGSQLVVSCAAGPLAKLPEVPPSQPTGPLPPAQLHALLLQCQAAQQEVEQLRSAAAAVAAQAVAAVQLPPSRPSVVQSAPAEYPLGSSSSSSSARSRRRRGSTSPSSSRSQVQVQEEEEEEEDLAVVLAAAAARARQRSSGADRFGVAEYSLAGTGLPGLEKGRGSMGAGDEGVGEAAVLAHKLQDATRRSRQLMRALNARLKPLGGVVVNVGDHASQQRVAAAAAAGCSRVVPAGVQPPPQQPPQQQGRSSWGTALEGQMLAPPIASPQGPIASPDIRHMYQLALAAIATQGQAAPAQGSELGAAAPAPGFTLRKRTTPPELGLPKTAAKRKR
ncbi:hypothetical protein QJQ45_013000 [Haematococcus lacustris]|nr:hypothetical protein QJQ45_013000 [Haematococcus lacustris]